LVKGKDQFVDHAGKLLNDLSTLITREPFSLTLSGHSDTKRVQVQERDFQHLLSGLHNIKLCLEDYRKRFVALSCIFNALFRIKN
jgi:hypothetical protein